MKDSKMTVDRRWAAALCAAAMTGALAFAAGALPAPARAAADARAASRAVPLMMRAPDGSGDIVASRDIGQ